MRRNVIEILLVAGVAFLHPGLAAANAGGHALAVSPGSPSGAMIGDPCPTFSWGAVRGAGSYELLVYRVGEAREEPVAVLKETFAGSVTAWTPALDRCLERGGRYAWTVRARVRGQLSDWSAPSLFRVTVGPSEAEFREALAVVQSYLDLNSRGESQGPSAAESREELPSASAPRSAAASPELSVAAATALKVDLGVEAASFKGDGSELTSLDPTNLAAGTAAIDISGTAAAATNADTVDGSHASAFVPAGGGSMFGTLTLSPGGAIANALLVTQGKVGIGTESPDNHLEIRSDDTVSLKINKAGAGGASEEADLIFEHEGSQIINYYNGTQLSWFQSPNDLFTIEQLGDIRVGIGTNGCVKDRDGTTIAGSCSSDARLKKDVAPLGGVLSRVTQLTPVQFHWRSEEYPGLELGTETQLGLVAQQVEEVLPELVVDGPDGFKRVRYHDIPIYLLQALREQQRESEALQEAVSDLSERLLALEE